MRQQDAQSRHNAQAARVNTDLAQLDDGGGVAAAAVGGRETQQYWRQQLVKQAERELVKRYVLEKKIDDMEHEARRQVRKTRGLEANVGDYAEKRRLCREQVSKC